MKQKIKRLLPLVLLLVLSSCAAKPAEEFLPEQAEQFNEIPIEHEEYLGNYDENEFAVSSEKAMSDLIDALVTSEKWWEEFKLNYSGMAVLEQEAYYQITLSTENEFSYSNIGVFWVNADSGAIYLKFDPTLDAEGYFSELSGDIPKEDSRTRLIAFP